MGAWASHLGHGQEQGGSWRLSRSRVIFALVGGLISLSSCGETIVNRSFASSTNLTGTGQILGNWRRRASSAVPSVDLLSLAFPYPNTRASDRAQLVVNRSPEILPVCPEKVSVASALNVLADVIATRPRTAPQTHYGEPGATVANDAGTFVLGSYREAPKGPLSFSPAPKYATRLASLGLPVTQRQHLQLALADVSAAYVTIVKSTISDVDISTILASRISGYSADDITNMKTNVPQMTSADLRHFIAAGVSASYVQGLVQSGSRNLSPTTILELHASQHTTERV